MIFRLLVFATPVVGKTECNMRRRKTRITSQRFRVGQAEFVLLTLLVERNPFDVRLFSTIRIYWIGNGSSRRFKVRVTVDRSVRSIFEKGTALLVGDTDCKWMTNCS